MQVQKMERDDTIGREFNSYAAKQYIYNRSGCRSPWSALAAQDERDSQRCGNYEK